MSHESGCHSWVWVMVLSSCGFPPQIKDQLSPAEINLEDVDTKMKPMIPQLRELKDLLANAQQTALGAHDTSEDAEREAAAGSKVRGSTCG